MEITEIEYINAVTIDLQDSDTFSEIEKLSCILFDKNTIDIQVGSKVLDIRKYSHNKTEQ